MEEKIEFYNFFHKESLKNLTELCEIPQDLKEKILKEIDDMDLKERVKLFLLLGSYYLQKLENKKND